MGGLVLGLALGAGASLGVNGNVLQAGSDDDLRCDEDGVTLSFNVQWNSSQNRYDVTGWKITDIDQPDCADKIFRVRLQWDGFTDFEFNLATNTATEISGLVSPPRPAAALIAWHIVMYDGPAP